VEPIAPDNGENDVIIGAGYEMYLNPLIESAPTMFNTFTKPLEPVSTKAEIVSGETMLNAAAEIPPKLTDLTPTKFVPVMVTQVPALADVG
jgi:hypothetical protein